MRGSSPRAPTTSSGRPGTGSGSSARSCGTSTRSGSSSRADGVLTTDFADIRDDPSIAVVAEVMGGLDPTGDHVLELLRAGKPVVTANKQLLARRSTELFAAAAEAGVQLRFEASRLRGDPGDQGAARGARRHERPPRARDRQRDDELHPHADGGRRRPTTRRSPRRSSWATPRPTRPRTSPAQTPPRRWRSWRASRSGRGSSSTTSPIEGIEEITAGARRGCSRARLGRPARRARRRSIDGRSTSASARRSSAGIIRSPSIEGAFNAVMLHGRRDPRDHALGPRRRRHRDGLGGRGRHGQRARDDRNRLPAERRLLALAADAAAGRAAGRRSTSGSRSTTGRACSPTSPNGSPSKGLGRASSSIVAAGRMHIGCAARSTSSPMHSRHRTALPQLSTRSRALPEVARPPRGTPRRHRARRLSDDAVTARRGQDAAPRTRRASPSGSGVELWVKWEGANPTGSFKDRGMAVAVAARARARRARHRLRVDREHRGVRGRLRRTRGPAARSSLASRGSVARGEGDPGARRRRRASRDRRHLQRRAPRGAEARRGARGSSTSTRSTPTGSRDSPRQRARCSSSSAASPDVLALPYGGGGNTVSYARGFGEALPRFLARGGGAAARDVRDRDPDRPSPCTTRGGRARPRALRRPHRVAAATTDRAGLALARAGRGDLLRARERRRASPRSRRPGCVTCASSASSRATA